MGADPVHPIIEALALLVEVAFNNQSRIFVGHYTQFPALGIRIAPFPAINQDLVRRCFFVTGAKGAKTSLGLELFHQKIGWTFAPFLGNNNPATDYRISS